MESIVNVRNPNPAELNKYLLGTDYLERSFRTDALTGRRAVVFGSLWHGIGSACAVALAKFGCDLVVVQGESEKAIGPTHDYLLELGHTNIHKFVADLSTPGSGKAAAQAIDQAHPDIDLVLYISGLSWYPLHIGGDPAQVTKMTQVNWLSGTEAWGHFLGRHLARRESNPEAQFDVGACSSIQALVAAADDAGIYSGTKAAIEQSLRNMGVQYGSRGVRTHCVAPGCVDSGRHRSTDHEFATTRQIGVETPWGELMPGMVVAEKFLASICTSRYSPSQFHIVDGGWSAAGNVNARKQNKG